MHQYRIAHPPLLQRLENLSIASHLFTQLEPGLGMASKSSLYPCRALRMNGGVVGTLLQSHSLYPCRVLGTVEVHSTCPQ